eukprot:TRINITY_DN3524_c0_g1_i11.p2 TRINITY_DN3524_c0_g1~~TRINITY_DN3524_c0_g1_i11.p2  ORF type:complete len:170 (+),score=26.04 TRINITY_DN3524_c0_g1_i11:74-511(+)
MCIRDRYMGITNILFSRQRGDCKKKRKRKLNIVKPFQMENEELYFILENPDGSLNVATQPHLRDRKIVICWNCKKKHSCTNQTKVMRCATCGSINGIPGTNLIPNEKIILLKCRQCRSMMKTYQNCIQVKCPTCLTINKVEQFYY